MKGVKGRIKKRKKNEKNGMLKHYLEISFGN